LKVIVSHDIDHLTQLENILDGFLIKSLLRNSVQTLARTNEPNNYLTFLRDVLRNKAQNIYELIEFNFTNGIKPTFFIGVGKGLGLSYSNNKASHWAKKILNAGCDLGVHGIAFNNYDEIISEYFKFRKLVGINPIGIRMHYLRTCEKTLAHLAQTGYLFDSSIYELSGPYLVDGMVEFPLHIMDVRMFYDQSRWCTVSFEQAQRKTLNIIEQVEQAKLPYLTVLFHDSYFCQAYSKWRDWYIWLIEYLSGQGYKFINYIDACAEVKNQHQSYYKFKGIK
jgi:hypothetical protein